MPLESLGIYIHTYDSDIIYVAIIQFNRQYSLEMEV